jgi:hypothetical protein
MAEIRSALVVASDTYSDPGMQQLRAPASDARALAAVLQNPEIGNFDVSTLLNRPAHEVNLAVEESSPTDAPMISCCCISLATGSKTKRASCTSRWRTLCYAGWARLVSRPNSSIGG